MLPCVFHFSTSGVYIYIYFNVNTGLEEGFYACVGTHFQLLVTTWTTGSQAPPSMEFSRQEHWSGLPFPTPGILPT